MTVAGGGAQPVAGGVLGTWDTTGIAQADHYTIRVVVTTDGFVSEARTIVYLEPTLGALAEARTQGRSPARGSC
jgi:hypothetical protein